MHSVTVNLLPLVVVCAIVGLWLGAVAMVCIIVGYALFPMSIALHLHHSWNRDPRSKG